MRNSILYMFPRALFFNTSLLSLLFFIMKCADIAQFAMDSVGYIANLLYETCVIGENGVIKCDSIYCASITKHDPKTVIFRRNLAAVAVYSLCV